MFCVLKYCGWSAAGIDLLLVCRTGLMLCQPGFTTIFFRVWQDAVLCTDDTQTWVQWSDRPILPWWSVSDQRPERSDRVHESARGKVRHATLASSAALNGQKAMLPPAPLASTINDLSSMCSHEESSDTHASLVLAGERERQCREVCVWGWHEGRIKWCR